MKIDEVIYRETLQRLADGQSIEQIVPFLYERGLSIIESIYVLKIVCKCSLREANRIVASHEVWAEIVAAAEPLQQAMQDDLEELQRVQESEENDEQHK